jgi:hypothetical protein
MTRDMKALVGIGETAYGVGHGWSSLRRPSDRPRGSGLCSSCQISAQALQRQYAPFRLGIVSWTSLLPQLGHT